MSGRKQGKHSSGQETGNDQFIFQYKKGSAKESSHYQTIVFISQASKKVVKNGKCQMYKVDSEEAIVPNSAFDG